MCQKSLSRLRIWAMVNCGNINKLRYWPLESVLHDKYLFPKLDVDAGGVDVEHGGQEGGEGVSDTLASFLTPMLRLHSDKRAKATDLIHHNWLESVVVQGEINVIRRAEQGEAEKRKILEAARESSRSRSRSKGGESGGERERKHLLDQSERDAMKPVEERVINGDDDGDEEEEDEDAGGGVRVAERGLAGKAPLLAAPPAPTSAGAKENASRLTRAMKGANATPPRARSSNSLTNPSFSPNTISSTLLLNAPRSCTHRRFAQKKGSASELEMEWELEVLDAMEVQVGVPRRGGRMRERLGERDAGATTAKEREWEGRREVDDSSSSSGMRRAKCNKLTSTATIPIIRTCRKSTTGSNQRQMACPHGAQAGVSVDSAVVIVAVVAAVVVVVSRPTSVSSSMAMAMATAMVGAASLGHDGA
ncbi:hypothetical protein B0H34DRAFT_802918 [Crassisporium funariophilum]|nr:hypothetical protein B0H34DRAFT_802918 [Crassisporium funariophilum]